MASNRSFLPGTVTGDTALNTTGERIDRVMDNTLPWLTVTSSGSEGDDVTGDINDNADTPAQDTVYLERGWLPGMGVALIWPAANTGAVTLAVNGGTALDVLTADGSALSAGQLPANIVIELVYYDGDLRIMSKIPDGGSGSPWTIETLQDLTGNTVQDFTVSIEPYLIIIGFDGIRLNDDGDQMLVQLGTSSGFVTSGYTGASRMDGTGEEGRTDGFVVMVHNSYRSISGTMTLTRAFGRGWVQNHTLSETLLNYVDVAGGGFVDLSPAAITDIRIKNTGSGTFQAGRVNILYL